VLSSLSASAINGISRMKGSDINRTAHPYHSGGHDAQAVGGDTNSLRTAKV